MMNFIPDSYSIDIVEEAWQASQAGSGYGWFARSCASLDASEFVEAIKDFHRLSFRVRQLDDAIKADKAGRLSGVQELVDFYKERLEKLESMGLASGGRLTNLILVDDDRLPLQPGEKPQKRMVRFRTLGCYPLTGAIESEADTIEKIVEEMMVVTKSERTTRVIDFDQEGSMEQKKREGYF